MQHLVEVAQDCGERLGRVGRALRQRSADRAGLDAGRGREARGGARGTTPTHSSAAAPSSRKSLTARRFAISRHGRVLSTCSFVSQARRACAIPSSR